MTTDGNTPAEPTTPPTPPADDQRDSDQPQQSIPYVRFKSVLDRAKAAEAELATLKASGSTPAPTGDNPPNGPDVSPNADQDYAALQTRYDAVSRTVRSEAGAGKGSRGGRQRYPA